MTDTEVSPELQKIIDDTRDKIRRAFAYERAVKASLRNRPTPSKEQ